MDKDNKSIVALVAQVCFYIYLAITATLADKDLSQLDSLLRAYLGAGK